MSRGTQQYSQDVGPGTWESARPSCRHEWTETLKPTRHARQQRLASGSVSAANSLDWVVVWHTRGTYLE